jgi:phosphodiesterase/alkaline phosphatase D-like protein/sugar lactone lactonase YvrE
MAVIAATLGIAASPATAESSFTNGYKGPLHYRGGPVQHHPHVYLISWGSVWKTHSHEKTLREEVEQFFKTLSGSPWQEVLTQYFDEAGPISAEVGFTSYVDESVEAPPKGEVSASQIAGEAAGAIEANNWPHGPDDQFMVAVPESSSTPACGAHDSTLNPTLGRLYFNYISVYCTDEITETASHEYAEMLTDAEPENRAWTNNGDWSTNEVADYCKQGTLPSGLVVSKLYDDHLHECVMSDPGAPRVYAGSEEATSVTATSGVLNGVVNPAGKDTSYHFEFGPTTSYGTSLPAEEVDVGSAWKNVAVEMPVNELEPGATYHFRIVATNSTGTNTGEDLEFTTPMDPESTIPTQLEGMPPTEPFDESSTSQTEFSTEWSALSWATGSEPKGEIATVYPNGLGGSRYGWVPTEPGPAVNGAYYNSSLAETGGGLATVATMAGRMFAGNHFSLWLDMPTPSGVRAGYELRAAPSYDDLYNVTLYKWTEGTRTELTSWSTPSLTDGDSFALIDHGNAVSGWINTGAGFSQVLSAKDDTFGAGYAGLEAEAEKGTKNERFFVLDNFKAGTLKQLPAATTDAATGVSGTSSTLNGRVNPEGLKTSYRFEYDEAEYKGEERHGTSVPIPDEAIGSGTSNIAVSQRIEGLKPEKTYHYRIVVSNEVGTTYSKEKTLTTYGPPKATTGAASGVSGSGATLNATINPENSETSYRFEYDEAEYKGEERHGTSVPIPDEAIGSGTANVAVSQAIAGLEPEKTYHYRVVASNEYGTTYGRDETLATNGASVVTMEGATAVGGSGATLHGRINPEGFETSYRFEYDTAKYEEGEKERHGTSVPIPDKSIGSGTSNVAVSQAVEGLEPEKIYHYRVVAESAAGTTRGEDTTFETTTASIGTQLASMAVSEPFDGSSESLERFSAGWSKLGWAKLKGEDTTTGWRPSIFLTGASYSSSFSDAELPLAAVVTVAAGPVNENNYFSLWLDMPTSAGVQAGYELRFTDVATDTYKITLSKWVEGTRIDLASKASYPLANGNSVALVDMGDRVSAWTDTGSGFSYLLGAADSTFGGGEAGLQGVGAATRLANFKAGLLSSGQVAAEAATEAATEVKASSAKLNGTINPEGSSTNYYFEWGRTTSYGSKTTEESAGSGSSKVAVSAPLSGLEPGATYHFRVVAKGATEVPGKDSKFSTPSDPRFNSDFGKEGSGNGQLSEPNGIATDSEGNIWVVDTANNRVEEFNSKGEYLRQCGHEGEGNGEFQRPWGIAIDSNNTIYVSDTFNNRVQKLNTKCEYTGQFGGLGTGNGQFKHPGGIAIDASNRPYVVDSGNDRVEKFSTTGGYLGQFGKEGTGNGEFKQPDGIAIGSNGRIFVVDSGNNRVQRFSSTFAYQSQFGTEGTGNGQFRSPDGIAVDFQAMLWVTDGLNDRLEKFNQEGEYLDQLGSEGSGPGQLIGPSAIAAPAPQQLLVSDQHNDRIESWTVKAEPPSVTTAAANTIAITTANLKGTINPLALATTYWFEYGESESLGSKTAEKSAGSGTVNVAFEEPLSGLKANTKYYFRVIAKSSAGTSTGAIKSFTTLKAPKATTEAATEVKMTSAKLNGTVNPEGSATNYYFEWGESTSYGHKTEAKSAGSGTSGVAEAEAISGLTANTTYHFRIVAEKGGYTVPGGEKEFTMTSNTPEEINLLPTLDALTRTESSLSGGGKWSALSWDTSTTGHNTGKDTEAGWAPNDSYPEVNGAYWNPTTFNDKSGDAAAITMQTSPGTESRYQSLWLDMGNPGSSKSGYQLRWILNKNFGNTYTVKLSRWSAGEETELASNTSVTITSGTTMAISDTGGTVTAWEGTGGSLTSILSASDTAFSEGYAGIEGSGYLSRAKNFKAGRLLGGAITGVSVLDSLQRSERPLAGKWTKTGWTEEIGAAWKENSWLGYGAQGSHLAGAYWNPTTFSDSNGPVVTAATLGTGPRYSPDYLSLWLDMPSPGSDRSGYEARFTGTNGSESAYKVELSKWVAGNRSVLAIKEGLSLPKNTTVALTETGGALTMWTGTSSLSPVLSATDSTYSSGYVGLEAYLGEGTEYDFRAGNVG